MRLASALASSSFLLLVAACGGDDDAPAPDAGPSITLTSSVVTEGARLPDRYTCFDSDVSPPLAWTAGPPGTLSYAIVLDDVSIDFMHSLIYDIPGDRLELPEDVDQEPMPADVPGAKQPQGYLEANYGYLGPCPDSLHTYELTIYALDVAELPGVTTETPRGPIVDAMAGHTLATGTLSFTYGGE